MKRILPPTRLRGFSSLPVVVGVFVTFVLSGCAQQPYSDDNAVKRSAILIGVANAPREPAEFVRNQRQVAPDFIPVGVTPPERALQPRNAAAATALEAELDARRKQSQGFATRAAPRSTYDGTFPRRPAPPPKELLPQ